MNIWAVGRNYRDHIKEMGSTSSSTDSATRTTSPLIFLKAGTALTSGETIHLWRGSGNIHHEIEIAVRFSTDLKFEYAALALDLTARDIQTKLKEQGHPWTLAKSFTESCPIGPSLPISESVPGFEFTFSVNGELRQKGNTQDMIFQFEELRTFLLANFPVSPGDWLLTGTPSGVDRLVPGDTGVATLRSTLGHVSEMHWKFI